MRYQAQIWCERVFWVRELGERNWVRNLYERILGGKRRGHSNTYRPNSRLEGKSPLRLSN